MDALLAVCRSARDKEATAVPILQKGVERVDIWLVNVLYVVQVSSGTKEPPGDGGMKMRRTRIITMCVIKDLLIGAEGA